MTNAPSLDAFSTESSPSSLLVAWHIALIFPRRLWDAYVAYLWYYEPNSWVARVASTFRILAFLLVLPVVVLTLLDVTSYVIARTLGVTVDDVKTSSAGALTPEANSDGTADGRRCAVPVPVHGVSTATATRAKAAGRAWAPQGGTSSAEGLASEDSVDPGGRSISTPTPVCVQAWNDDEIAIQTPVDEGKDTAVPLPSSLQPKAFFVAGDGHLRLAGEGVFSPAVSGPPSPLTPRTPLRTLTTEGQGNEEESIMLRRRVQGAREGEQVL